MRLNVTVIGAGGYVGSMLVPQLLHSGYEVTALDTFWYGKETLNVTRAPKPMLIQGDIRNERDVSRALVGADIVIHLACISNDPSCDLDPELTKSINLDSFPMMLKMLDKHRIQRFIFASTSSVYGVKKEANITEDAKCDPLTDYSKYKLMCEEMLRAADLPNTCWTILRPATVCGWSPRMRLDLVMNAMTIHGLINKKIHVHGGSQLRPNINIRDMTRAYIEVLRAPEHKINKETFNVGDKNLSLSAIANQVARTLRNPAIEIFHEPSKDPRSYHINSDKIQREVGFRARMGFEQAISSILLADHKMRNPLTNSIFYNVKHMQKLGVK